MTKFSPAFLQPFLRTQLVFPPPIHSDQIVTKCAQSAQNDPKFKIGRALSAHAQFAHKMANFPEKVGLFHTNYQNIDIPSINFLSKIH